MVNIELTPLQVEELKNFYTNELDKIQKRADEIREILEKLVNKPEPIANRKVVIQKKEKQPKPEKQIIIIPLKKTNKQSKWSDKILELLKEKQKPLSIKEIVKYFEKQINIPKTDLKKTVIAIQQSLFRLRTHNKKIQNIKRAGKAGKLYGLTEWTDKSVIPLKNAKEENTQQIKKINQKPKTIIKRDNKPPLTLTYNWPKFIFETLNKTKRVLSAKDLLKYAMVYYSLPKLEKATTRVKLASALSRSEKITKSLKTCKKEGQAGRFYGLPEWFGGDNKLIAEYK